MHFGEHLTIDGYGGDKKKLVGNQTLEAKFMELIRESGADES